ncbi:unnamed protein product, partial [Lampetra planeri]
ARNTIPSVVLGDLAALRSSCRQSSGSPDDSFVADPVSKLQKKRVPYCPCVFF